MPALDGIKIIVVPHEDSGEAGEDLFKGPNPLTGVGEPFCTPMITGRAITVRKPQASGHTLFTQCTWPVGLPHAGSQPGWAMRL